MLRIKIWLAAAAAVVLALLSTWLGGRRSAKTAAKAEELNEYVETRKRIDEIDGDRSVDDDRDWLRDRGKR
jgi:hypothetical protein